MYSHGRQELLKRSLLHLLLTVRSWLTAGHKRNHNKCGAEIGGFVGGYLHQLSMLLKLGRGSELAGT